MVSYYVRILYLDFGSFVIPNIRQSYATPLESATKND